MASDLMGSDNVCGSDIPQSDPVEPGLFIERKFFELKFKANLSNNLVIELEVQSGDN
jgi:hypothetical protein